MKMENQNSVTAVTTLVNHNMIPVDDQKLYSKTARLAKNVLLKVNKKSVSEDNF